jgi:hypothetical protein
MSDIYSSMNLHSLQLEWAQKQQELAQAESAGASRQELIIIYRELKTIQYHLSMAAIRHEEAIA